MLSKDISRTWSKSKGNRRRSDPDYTYMLDFEGLEGVAVSTKVPPEESFSLTYIIERVLATSDLVFSGSLARIRSKVVSWFTSEVDDVRDIDDFIRYFPPFKSKIGFIPVEFPVHDPERFVQLPSTAGLYEDEDYYGEQRLAGVNPVMLRALESDDPRAPIVASVPGASAAISAGKMFVADYTGKPVGDSRPDFILPEGGIKGGEYEYKGKQLRKALPTAIGFFILQPSGQIRAVAIQLHENGRIYTPSDERYDWLMAKTALGVSDFNHHEMVTHLGQKHFYMEAFAIATRRCFDDDHPLSYLLRAHTRFMIANNRIGRDFLIRPGGNVDFLLAGEIGESVEIARLGCASTHFINDNFVNDIEARKVTKDRLPYYPYRDDGQLLWDAIWNFLTEYIAATYASDKELQEDKELQLWCQELADPKQGAVYGMKAKVNTAEELVEVLTTMIFISGPAHCAVNFSQLPMGGYVPNQPLAVRDPYRQLSKRPASEPLNEKDLLSMLPNQGMNLGQTEIVFTLSCYKFDKLGHYDKSFESLFELSTEELLADHPKGKGLKTAIDNFQATLDQVEQQISSENAKRRVPYEFLAPSNVLNSTSI